MDEFEYYLPPIQKNVKSKTSVIKFVDTLKLAFSYLSKLRRRQKLVYLVFFLSTIMISIGFTNLFSALTVDESDFLDFNRDLIHVYDYKYHGVDTVADMKKLKSDVEAKYLLGIPQNIYSLETNLFLQLGKNASINGLNSIIPIDVIDDVDKKLVSGRLPEKPGEIVIDSSLVAGLMEDLKSHGVLYTEQLIGLKYKHFWSSDAGYTIVGIIKGNNPNFYFNLEDYKMLIINMSSKLNFDSINNLKVSYYYKYEDIFDPDPEPYLLSELNLQPNQILVTTDVINDYGSNKLEISDEIEYEIYGVITEELSMAFIQEEDIEDLYYHYLLNQSEITIFSNNKELTLKN